MKRAVREHLLDFVAIIGLVAIAVGVSYVILQNQRLRIPYLEDKPHVLHAEFATGQAVTAGQGQTVRVSGVRIGDIGDVRLKNGRALIEMQIDKEYADFVHTNATALLRPKTGLKDMFIDLDPGTEEAPVAKAGWTLPIRSTAPDVNPDEVYSALDADTRDYLKLLVNGAGRGLEGRGGDLRDVLRRFEPTHRDLARVNTAVAERRRHLRRLIHSLRVLNDELARDPDQLAGLIGSSAQVLRAFASEEQNLSNTVRELPSALRQTTDTLGRVESFADVLGPAAERLRPAARKLRGANEAVIPFAREIAPVLRTDIRPFVREARPLIRELQPGATRLSAATGDLGTTFAKLNRLVNLLGHNPGGREGPEKADRHEGYLFWLAWVQHMGLNLFSSSDAHGVYRPVTLGTPCATIQQLVTEEPELEYLAFLSPILADSEACGTEPARRRSEAAAKAGRPLDPMGGGR
jgi:phospholipid/cholesterol/gamma-HCH transport system substrate-binding protein